MQFGMHFQRYEAFQALIICLSGKPLRTEIVTAFQLHLGLTWSNN